MERFVYQSEEASSSQPLTQSSFQPLTQTTLSSGLSSSLQLSSSPLPPTAREKGKGKARLKGDVYDVHLVPPFIHSSAGKERLSNNMSTFTYQGDVFVRDKVLDPMKCSKSTSIAWKYGEAVVKKDYPRSELKWYCYCCERDNRGQGLPGAPGGFKNRHLEDIHGYDKDTNTFRNIPRDNNNNDAGVSKPLLRRTEIFRKQFHESWDQYPDTKALWVPEVQRLMLQVWDQEYRKIESTAPRAVQVEVLPSSDKTFGMFPRARSVKHGDCGSQQDVDHFRRYLEEDPIPMEQGVEFDTIQYWRASATRSDMKRRRTFRVCLSKKS
ncbi:hypothetical protein E4U25_005161 [Claviceps purpurea]|nr:hypothetical protein E4U25_005161 [Claviceps purpurea]